MSSELYPIFSDEDLRGRDFFEATFHRSRFSVFPYSFRNGDRLICQKTDRNVAIVRAIMRHGKWRSTAPTYDTDHIYLVSKSDLKWIVSREKMEPFEGIEKYINPSRDASHA